MFNTVKQQLQWPWLLLWLKIGASWVATLGKCTLVLPSHSVNFNIINTLMTSKIGAFFQREGLNNGHLMIHLWSTAQGTQLFLTFLWYRYWWFIPPFVSLFWFLLWFHMWILGLNLGLLTCKANTQPTQLYPQHSLTSYFTYLFC